MEFPRDDREHPRAQAFREFIQDPPFPCVGAKSAWALSESFLVDTVKAGRRTMVRAARNLEHQVLLVGEASDLPDGTTICVPVEVSGHAEAWTRAVLEVAGAHDPGVVLVDGAAVESLAGGMSWIGPVSCRRLDRPDRSAVMVRSGGTLFSSVTEVTRRVLEGTGGLTASSAPTRVRPVVRRWP